MDGVYGQPPVELAQVPEGAVQFSPLMAGASRLEDLGAGALKSLTILAPPGTIERRYVLAQGLRALAPGGALVVMAPKDKGGSRLANELKNFGCEVVGSAKKHFRLCVGTRPAEITGADEAIADGALQKVEALGLWSQPGVFSWNRPDPGSVLLFKNLPELKGKGADLGCGIGFLAPRILSSSKVEALALIELDQRALDAARRNITDPRASFVHADVRASGVGATGLDFIVLNPPFHDGGTEDQSLGQVFIKRAAEALRNGGQCYIVANRHLPYEAVLKLAFKRVEMIADGGGYKVFEAQK